MAVPVGATHSLTHSPLITISTIIAAKQRTNRQALVILAQKSGSNLAGDLMFNKPSKPPVEIEACMHACNQSKYISLAPVHRACGLRLARHVYIHLLDLLVSALNR